MYVQASTRVSMRHAFEEHAQNGVRRDYVPDSIGGARRTLCALQKPILQGVYLQQRKQKRWEGGFQAAWGFSPAQAGWG